MFSAPFCLYMTTVIATPIVTSSASGVDSYFEPMPITRLPILEYAKLMGIDPARFMNINMPRPALGDRTLYAWTYQSWQGNGGLGRMDVAIAISTAEREIEDYLGTNISPDWDIETVRYPKAMNQYRWNISNGYRPAVQLSRGKVIAGGVRATETIGQYQVEYLDLDHDGINEVGQIVFDSPHDLKEIQFFPPGVGLHPSWEIRWPRSWSRAGDEYTVIFDLWYLLRPDIACQYQQDIAEPIQAVDVANFLEYVDIYRVFNDDSSGHVQFSWTGLSAYDGDSRPHVQNGFSEVYDSENGMIVPRWSAVPSFDQGPDNVHVHYYSGYRSSEYESGLSLNPIEFSLADAIRCLATARLDRDLTGGANVISLSQSLREDMAAVSPAGNFLAMSEKIQESPFGSRRGEVQAWRIVDKLPRHYVVGVF